MSKSNAGAKRPPIRLDGLYIAMGDNGKRHYLRFTEKEVWIEASQDTPDKVAVWLGGEESRTPKRGEYEFDGSKLTLKSSFVSMEGELRGDSLAVTAVLPDSKTNDTESHPFARDYEFQAMDPLPPVTDQGRHLADCFAQYQEFLRTIPQSPRPAQPQQFFEALEALAKWVEMTPANRQRITQAPHVLKSPIARLRGYSQVYLTPAGQLPLPQLLENHARFRPLALRMISAQFQRKIEALFFVEWLLRSTPPPLAVEVFRELISLAPRDEFGAAQIKLGLNSIPLRSIPGGREVVEELATSETPAFRQLGSSLQSGPGGRRKCGDQHE